MVSFFFENLKFLLKNYNFFFLLKIIILIRSHILQDVQNSTKKTPPPKSIILLGDNETGRTTLISRLKKI